MPPSRTDPAVRARPLVLLLLLLAVVGGTLPAAAAPTAPRSYAASIETLSPYQGQRMCSPTAKPGVVAFRDLLLRTYPGTRSMGISRACTVGGRSEHKEGRAFDWGVNVARPAEKAAADDMLRWLLATDRYGNRFANARRLGVQYVIWNKRIWSSYAPTWRAYSGPSPHTDHVHVSFNWPGANKQTSFWTGRVVNATAATIPSAPPTTTAPVPPKTPTTVVAPPPPVRDDQTWTVPANRPKGASSPGSVQQGKSYLLTVRGVWAPSRSTKADAKCFLASGARRWSFAGPGNDLGDVLVNNRDIDLRPMTPVAYERRCDVAGHVYTAVVTPRVTGVVTLRVLDTGYTDNTGALSARLTRYKPGRDAPRVEELAPEPVRTVETLRVPATSAQGAATRQSYAAGSKVLLRVSGTWSYGTGMTADAECSMWPTDRRWRAVSEWDPEGLGHLDLTVNGKVLPWTPFNAPKEECDPRHEYFLRATLSTTGPLRMAVRDDRYTDNAGTLTVTVEPQR